MEKQTQVKEICPTTTQEWVKNGAILVDVREKDEVEIVTYDVPNYINMPLSVFEDEFEKLPKDKDMVLVCRSGARSLRATAFLIHHGYHPEKVVNMQHGIIRWIEKGFPTKGDASSFSEKQDSCCSPSGGCC
jgi:rhodanese-related sulfurtransferase